MKNANRKGCSHTSHLSGTAAGQKTKWRKPVNGDGLNLRADEIGRACEKWLIERKLWTKMDFHGNKITEEPQ